MAYNWVAERIAGEFSWPTWDSFDTDAQDELLAELWARWCSAPEVEAQLARIGAKPVSLTAVYSPLRSALAREDVRAQSVEGSAAQTPESAGEGKGDPLLPNSENSHRGNVPETVTMATAVAVATTVPRISVCGQAAAGMGSVRIDLMDDELGLLAAEDDVEDEDFTPAVQQEPSSGTDLVLERGTWRKVGYAHVAEVVKTTRGWEWYRQATERDRSSLLLGTWDRWRKTITAPVKDTTARDTILQRLLNACNMAAATDADTPAAPLAPPPLPTAAALLPPQRAAEVHAGEALRALQEDVEALKAWYAEETEGLRAEVEALRALVVRQQGQLNKLQAEGRALDPGSDVVAAAGVVVQPLPLALAPAPVAMETRAEPHPPPAVPRPQVERVRGKGAKREQPTGSDKGPAAQLPTGLGTPPASRKTETKASAENRLVVVERATARDGAEASHRVAERLPTKIRPAFLWEATVAEKLVVFLLYDSKRTAEEAIRTKRSWAHRSWTLRLWLPKGRALERAKKARVEREAARKAAVSSGKQHSPATDSTGPDPAPPMSYAEAVRRPAPPAAPMWPAPPPGAAVGQYPTGPIPQAVHMPPGGCFRPPCPCSYRYPAEHWHPGGCG